MEERTGRAWVEVLYSPYWTAIFTRLAREKFGRLGDPAELAADARQKFSLRLAQIEAPLDRAYILVAFKHALVDVFREQQGRREPRQWLRAYGSLGARLFDLYCLLRLTLAEILDALRRDSEFSQHPEAEAAKVRLLLREMDRRQECEGRQETLPLGNTGDDDAPLFDPADPGPDPEAAIQAQQAAAIKAWLFGGSWTELPPWRQVDAIPGLGALSLDDEEALVLRGYLAGLTEQRVGELLGGLSVRQVRYRRQTAVDKLRAVLRAAGIAFDELMPPET